MTNSPDGTSIKEIAELSGEENGLSVSCTTCHRGYKKPEQLQDVIYATIKETGIQSGIDEYKKLREQYYGKGTFNFDENALIQLGYRLINDKAVQDAVAVFKLNTEMNPESANAFDSLGDAYVAAGDYKNAVASAENCIDLLDNVIKINDTFHSNIRKSAQDKIDKYKNK